jgi:hypothetical protein
MAIPVKMPPTIARYGLVEDTMEIGGTLLIVAILIGGIDLPLFYNVSTTGWGSANILMWGVITIIAIAVLIMMIVDKMKNYQR